MKRSLLTIIAFIFVLAQPVSDLVAQNRMPAFSFTDLEGEIFTYEKLEPGLSTMVMFFDPWCDHCQEQARAIVEAEDKFQDIQLVWVTTEMAEAARTFRDQEFGEANLPHLYILTDPEFMFDAYFGYSEVPSIYLYDGNWKRTKVFRKEQPAEVLLKYL